MRAEVPPSVSQPEPPTPPNAFSISSIQRMHGEIDSATASERRIFDSVEPERARKEPPASKRSSGIFHAAETAFAPEALAAPLHAEEERSLRGGQPESTGILGERERTFPEPLLQEIKSADVLESLGRLVVFEDAGFADQLLLLLEHDRNALRRKAAPAAPARAQTRSRLR